MLLFIQHKTLHQYPVDKRCSALYRQEPLRDTVPRDVKQCPYCMHVWPGDAGGVARAN